MSAQLHRRIDRLFDSVKISQKIPLEQVSAEALLSGRCFADSRAWKLEDLVGSSQDEHPASLLRRELQ